MKKKLFIYGMGGFGKEVFDCAKRMDYYNEIFYIDDFSFDNKIVFSFDYFITNINNENCECIVALGEVSSRNVLKDKLISHGCNFATIIDPSSIISPLAKIGVGVIICQLAFIGPDAEIGNHSLVNTGSIIGHDIKISENCVISASVKIGGKSVIGQNVYLGMGSIIKEGITIENNSILGMGSVLHSDLSANLLALGNPARPIRKIEDDFKVFS